MSKTTHKFLLRGPAVHLKCAAAPSVWCWTTKPGIHHAGLPFYLALPRLAARPSLHEWIKKPKVGSGKQAGLPRDVAEKIKALDRDNRERHLPNQIFRKALAYFAMAELDRRFKL